MSVTNGGTPGPFPQPGDYGRTEAGGFRTLIWEDTNKVNIDNLAVQCELQQLSYRVTESFGKARIEVQQFWNNLTIELPVDLWEYNSHDTAKDILQAATNTGITGTLSEANISVIRNALNGTFPTNAPTSAGTQYLDASGNSFGDGNPGNALIIYNLMKSGMQDYFVQAPILRHTQTISAVYPITLSQLNVGKLISTSTLFALETVPYWAISGLPTTAPPAFSDGKQFQFAWLKGGPTINQIAYRKITIVQEFQYGLWATAVYGVPL